MVRGLMARCVTRYSVKNCWTNDANDGGRGDTSVMAHLRCGHERLEFACPHRHQLWNASEIPVGIGHHGVAYVGGQRQHRLIDVHSLRLPKHHTTNDEGMPQIVDARRSAER